MTWETFLISTISALLSSIFTLIGGIILLKISERFRKFALWEPFARDMWIQQMTICTDIVSNANRALNDALFCFDVFNPDKNEQKKCAKNLSLRLDKLGDLKGKRLVLCTSNFNQAVEEFTQQMLIILGEHTNGKLNQKLSSNLPQLWFGLVDESRIELKTDDLNTKTKEAIKNTIDTQSGNSVLPY